jgi:hypothetical protein
VATLVEAATLWTFEHHDISAVLGTTNREASLAFRMQDGDNGYIVCFSPDDIPVSDPHLSLIRRLGGEEKTLAIYRGQVFKTLGRSAKITVVATGPWMEVRLNDAKVFCVKDAEFASGFLGLRIYGWGDFPCDATYDKLTFY